MTTSSEGQASILAIAKKIGSLSELLNRYIEDNSLPPPSFESGYRAPETVEYEHLLAPLVDTTQDFLRLINGPKKSITSLLLTHYDLAAYQVALEFDFFDKVPLGPRAGIHLNDLASAVGIDTDRVGRIMRFLVTQQTFEESSPDEFRHTSSSAIFVEDPGFKAAALREMDEMFTAASKTSACLAESPYRSDSEHCPFRSHYDVPIFQYYAQNPLKGARFAQAMTAVSQVNRQISILSDGFDWDLLHDGKVVDIGGGNGHVSIALAQRHSNLTFIVQDASTNTLIQGQQLSKFNGLGDRVTFQQHDFFTPQPIQDASAFVIRQCLHNQNDEGVVKILRALVPALEKCKPGTPLLINETILPEPGFVKKAQEHDLRRMDLMMLVVLGAKQRTEREFRKLIKEADERFEIMKVHAGENMGLVEVNYVQPQ